MLSGPPGLPGSRGPKGRSGRDGFPGTVFIDRNMFLVHLET